MNTKAGFWSALGAVVGSVVGATAAKYAVQARPRHRYDEDPDGPGVDAASIMGGAAGAIIGAFVGGAVGAPEEPLPELTK